MKNILVLLCTGMLFSCAGDKTNDTTAPVAETAPVAQETPAMPKIVFSAAEYTSTPPLDFIHYLSGHKADGWIAVEKAPDKWVNREDVDKLMGLISSNDPSAGVVLTTSNIIPPKNVQSTIGVEALLLIESYRKDAAYPSHLSSLDYAKALTPDPATKVLMLKPSAKLISDTEAWYKTLK